MMMMMIIIIIIIILQSTMIPIFRIMNRSILFLNSYRIISKFSPKNSLKPHSFDRREADAEDSWFRSSTGGAENAGVKNAGVDSRGFVTYELSIVLIMSKTQQPLLSRPKCLIHVVSKHLYRGKSIQHSFGHLPFVRLKACVGWYQNITVKLKISV